VGVKHLCFPDKKEFEMAIQKQKTNMEHVFLIDWDDTGVLKEIALVKETPDGTMYGIDIDRLHTIDKSRLKKVLVSKHADKYPLWELLASSRLSNGMNALDFFHFNYVKVKRPRGAAQGGSLSGINVASDAMIGAGFSNPANALVDRPVQDGIGLNDL
jgi:hypothetical protein